MRRYKFFLLLIILLFVNCKSSQQTKNYFMETNKINSTQYKDQFDLDAYYINQINGQWKYTQPDGIQIEIIGIIPENVRSDMNNTFQVMSIPTKPAYYKLMQIYYENGKIKERGKYLCGTIVGIWDYYDQQGNKKQVNEDEQLGQFSYNDVFLFLHQKGLVDINTGKNRERLELFFNKDENYWRVFLQGTPENNLCEEYRLDGSTGKVKNYFSYRN